MCTRKVTVVALFCMATASLSLYAEDDGASVVAMPGVAPAQEGTATRESESKRKADALATQLRHETIGLKFTSVPLRDLLDNMSERTGHNFLVEDRCTFGEQAGAIDTDVTLQLNKVSVYDAIRYIAKAVNGTFELDGEANVVIIKPNALNETMTSEVPGDGGVFGGGVATGGSPRPGATAAATTCSTDVAITPIDGVRYLVNWKVTQLNPDGKPALIANPKMVITDDAEGQVSIDGDGRVISCTAQVTTKEKTYTAMCTIAMEADGRKIWSHAFHFSGKK